MRSEHTKFAFILLLRPLKHIFLSQTARKSTPKTPGVDAMPFLVILVDKEAYVQNLAVLREWYWTTVIFFSAHHMVQPYRQHINYL